MSPSKLPKLVLHMQSWMTVMILRRTTSSPDESLASNLQCDTVLLNSVRALSKPTEFTVIRPETKKTCKAERAVEVIGPVDSGERIIEKKGAKRVGSGKLLMSVHYALWGSRQWSDQRVTHHLHL